MKIGIITIQKCDNFGADLQAYALGAKLRKLGYDAENIDYLFYKNPRHVKGAMEKPVLPVSIVNRAKEFLFPIVAKVKRFLKGSNRARSDAFGKWFSQNVVCGKEYRSVDSLYDDPPDYDVYMVGSDQVWNPRLYSNIKPYFLDFVPEGKRCVSYASSFGVNELPGGVFRKFKQWLGRFDAIGVREASGCRIVNSMALKAEVRHVLDPTLLLSASEWSEVAVEPKNHPPAGEYVLLYDLIPCESLLQYALADAKANNLEMVRITSMPCGPGEFIWLFAHAKRVYTNSFHGTVFSILHQKDFKVVIPSRMSNAGRIGSILEALGLQGRMTHEHGECVLTDDGGGIDWNGVQKRLSSLRAESVDFLVRSVEGRNI